MTADTFPENLPSVSVIVLTMGDRMIELEALIESLEPCQPFDGVLVGNGFEPPTYPGWRSVPLSANVGISAGRRIGADNATGDLLVFLDDDAKNLTAQLLQSIQQAFRADDEIGALALRVVVEGTDYSLSEWQPRIRGRGQLVAGNVTSFHGAAHAVRTSIYNRVGGYPDIFWYSHEETDLAWRVLDTGANIAYRPDLTLSHPRTKPSRHNQYLWFSARNRVWLARKHLPLVLAGAYLAAWTLIQLMRCRSIPEVKSVGLGTSAGLRQSPGRRKPLSWQTVWRMTRLGRPPII